MLNAGLGGNGAIIEYTETRKQCSRQIIYLSEAELELK